MTMEETILETARTAPAPDVLTRLVREVGVLTFEHWPGGTNNGSDEPWQVRFGVEPDEGMEDQAIGQGVTLGAALLDAGMERETFDVKRAEVAALAQWLDATPALLPDMVLPLGLASRDAAIDRQWRETEDAIDAVMREGLAKDRILADIADRKIGGQPVILCGEWMFKATNGTLYAATVRNAPTPWQRVESPYSLVGETPYRLAALTEAPPKKAKKPKRPKGYRDCIHCR